MNISGYTVEILGGKHFNNDNNDTYYADTFSNFFPIHKKNIGAYVELNNGQFYSILLKNNNSSRCNAHLRIDGDEVGIWRIPAYGNIIIKRPSHINKRFVFYKTKSAPYQSGIVTDKFDNGLIQVYFLPEKGNICCRDRPPYMEYSNFDNNLQMRCNRNFIVPNKYGPSNMSSCCKALSCPAFEEGATALKGNSGQHFEKACYIDEDNIQKVIITVRLVGRKYPNHYVYDVEPLNPYKSNPVPPPMFERTDICRPIPGSLYPPGAY